MSRSGKTIRKFTIFNILVILAGSIACAYPFLLSLLNFNNNQPPDVNDIEISGKNVINAKTGLQETEQYRAWDSNIQLSDCD
jgi:hypothetical protein